MTDPSAPAFRPAGRCPTGTVLAPAVGELRSVLLELMALVPRVEGPDGQRLARAIEHLHQVLAVCGTDAAQVVGMNR